MSIRTYQERKCIESIDEIKQEITKIMSRLTLINMDLEDIKKDTEKRIKQLEENKILHKM